MSYINTPLKQNEHGLAHVIGVFLVVFVVAAIGFAGFRVYQGQQSSDDTATVASDLPAVSEAGDDTGEILPEGEVSTASGDAAADETVDIDSDDASQLTF